MRKAAIRFSVIIPCYNVTPYLAKCLDSIFVNDVAKSEIILVDDGSTDDFILTVQDYFGRRLKGERTKFTYKGASVIVLLQENGGVSAARNRGIAESSKDYLLFVDPDDTVASNWLSTLNEHLKENPVDLCVYGFSTFYESLSNSKDKSYITLPCRNYFFTENEQSIERLLPRWIGISLRQTRSWAQTGNVTPRREFGAVWRNAYCRDFIVEHNILFDEKIKVNEDSIFNANCAFHARTVSSLDISLYMYVARMESAMVKLCQDSESMIRNAVAVLNARKQLVKKLKEKGYDADEWVCGSTLFTLFELMGTIKSKTYPILRDNYIKDPFVKGVIKDMPFVGKRIFDINLLLMKCHLYPVVFLMTRLAAKMGIIIWK